MISTYSQKSTICRTKAFSWLLNIFKLVYKMLNLTDLLVSIIGVKKFILVYEQYEWSLLTKLPNSENLCGQASLNIANITVKFY